MKTISLLNTLAAIIFTAFYTYQFLYIPISWVLKQPATRSKVKQHDFAVLICARNEAAVIADLLASLKNQTYPADKIHVFVIADNCTDNTAAIARNNGATVYQRFNHQLVGKGYAMDELLRHIETDYPSGFDGYLVFDADNLLEKDYIEQMNRCFCDGYDIITGYRNSKNYGDNWISAGYALWFLKDCRYLNYPRHLLGISSCVSGTGFLFSRTVLQQMNGWPYHTLTEDTEFTVDQILHGNSIAYCPQAVLYDEQPTTFRQSWQQRMRWSRGYMQVFHKYGRQLLKSVFKGSFSSLDMILTIMPAFILSSLTLLGNLILAAWAIYTGEAFSVALAPLVSVLIHSYMILFGLGAITLVSEWRNIQTSAIKKIRYLFSFPIFMFTYLPIALTALIVKTSWKPIHHTVTARQAGLRMVK